jgi:hypothetical protein
MSTLQVIELTVLGAGQASTSAITDLARNDAPTDAGAAFDQQQAAADASDSDLSPLVGAPPPSNDPNRDAGVRLEKDMVKIWEQVDAANNGDALNVAIQQFQKWDQDTHGLTPDQYQSLTGTFWDDFVSKFKKLLDKAAQDCKKSSLNPPPQGVGPLQNMLGHAMNPPSHESQWSVLQNKMTSAFGDSVLSQAWSDLKQGICGTFLVYKPAGAIGTVCSLARPFQIKESAPFLEITMDYYPISMTMGTINVHEEFTAAHGTFDGVGTYDLEIYTPKEANIQVQWAGHYVQPGENIPDAVQKPLHYDLHSVDGADCP